MPFIQRFGSATARGFGLGKGGIVRLPGITESATAADLIQTLLTRTGLITETASIADTLNNNISTASAINETASVLDENNYSTALNSIVTDSASATDSLLTILNAQASVADVTLILDQTFRISTSTSEVTENIIAADLISPSFATLKSLADVATISVDEFDAIRLTMPFATDAAVGVDSIDSETTPPAIGLLGGGYAGNNNYASRIQAININSQSTAVVFGALQQTQADLAACSSTTRAIWAGGFNNFGRLNTITYTTIAFAGTTANFGLLLQARDRLAGASNATLGVFAGGATNSSSTSTAVNYIVIATTGTTYQLGNIVTAQEYLTACANPTTLVAAGGSTNVSTMQQMSFASVGTFSVFGNLTQGRAAAGGLSSATRAVFGGGFTGSNNRAGMVATIDYVEFASLGNAATFGNLTQNLIISNQATSSPTRGLFMGGLASSGRTWNVSYITISTLGNALAFGQLDPSTLSNQIYGAACSNGHGGL